MCPRSIFSGPGNMKSPWRFPRNAFVSTVSHFQRFQKPSAEVISTWPAVPYGLPVKRSGSEPWAENIPVRSWPKSWCWPIRPVTSSPSIALPRSRMDLQKTPSRLLSTESHRCSSWSTKPKKRMPLLFQLLWKPLSTRSNSRFPRVFIWIYFMTTLKS